MICKIGSADNLTVDNSEYKLNEEKFIEAVDIISNDIKEKYDLNDETIGLLGVARGGLPLLVAVSHKLGKRNISIIQLQMNNSDKKYDYGKVKYISSMINEDVKKVIVFEDIIYKGQSSNYAVDILKERGKEVIGIYTIAVDEGLKEIEIDKDREINYVYEIKRDCWIYFLWEKEYKI